MSASILQGHDETVAKRVLNLLLPISILKNIIFALLSHELSHTEPFYFSVILGSWYIGLSVLYYRKFLSPTKALRLIASAFILILTLHWVLDLRYANHGYFQTSQAVIHIVMATVIFRGRERWIYSGSYFLSVLVYFGVHFSLEVDPVLRSKIPIQMLGFSIWTIGFSLVLQHYQKVIDELTQKLLIEKEFVSSTLKVILHDLRSPLAAMKVYSELQKTELSPKVERCVGRMESIIDQVQNLYLLKVNSARFKRQPIRLDKTISEVLEILKIKSDAKGLVIELPPREQLALSVWGEETLLSMQVLHNLLSNAIKFSPRQSVIRISSSVSESKVVLQISDSGPGISEDDARKLFVEKLSLSTLGSEGEKGTGFGLQITQMALELIGGKLSYKKTPTGSTFSIELDRSTELKLVQAI